NLIDLRQWLTAKVPDPRIAGVPFKSLTASFAGRDGVFYTGDLLLSGHVMTIAAAGGVNVARDTMDMEVGMRPFSTVTGVVNKIPIVGRVTDNTGGILSAYFHVNGP